MEVQDLVEAARTRLMEQLTLIVMDATGTTITQMNVEFMMMMTSSLRKCVAPVNNQLDKNIWK